MSVCTTVGPHLPFTLSRYVISPSHHMFAPHLESQFSPCNPFWPTTHLPCPLHLLGITKDWPPLWGEEGRWHAPLSRDKWALLPLALQSASITAAATIPGPLIRGDKEGSVPVLPYQPDWSGRQKLSQLHQVQTCRIRCIRSARGFKHAHGPVPLSAGLSKLHGG